MNKTLNAHYGYSKAVDMWSIGSLASAILTGDVIFINRNDPEFRANPKRVILTLAAQCNLEQMDESPTWNDVGHRARDFVRKLLVLNENQRLTAEEALQHRWFTVKRHRLLFESVYEKSIRGWHPSPKDLDIVEDLDVLLARTESQPTKSVAETRVAPLTISSHFIPLKPNIEESTNPVRYHPYSVNAEEFEKEIQKDERTVGQQAHKDMATHDSLRDADYPFMGFDEPVGNAELSECPAGSDELRLPCLPKTRADTNVSGTPDKLSLSFPSEPPPFTTQELEKQLMPLSHLRPSRPGTSNPSLPSLPSTQSELPEPPSLSVQDSGSDYCGHTQVS